MSLQTTINEAIKNAMRAKDAMALEALRAVKSEIIVALTASGSKETLSQEEEIKLLQKLVKQRKDSAAIYHQQNRPDLAAPEEAQATIIEAYLPEQLSEEALETIVKNIIEAGNFSGMANMGAVMAQTTQQVAGQADGKTISAIVKKLLSA